MKVGDVYYEKHTVVGISTRTGTVSETDVEIVNVLPIDVLDKIKADVRAKKMKWRYGIKDDEYYIELPTVLDIIDKYKSEMVK